MSKPTYRIIFDKTGGGHWAARKNSDGSYWITWYFSYSNNTYYR